MANRNLGKLNTFPEPNKKIFLNFIEEINKLGWWVLITSGYRSYSEQKRLHNNNKKNAKAGNSPHNDYRAIDINIFQLDSKGNRIKTLYKNSPRKDWINSGVPKLAETLGLKWGDFANYVDRVHFEIPRNSTLISNGNLVETETIFKESSIENWNLKVGEVAIKNDTEKNEVPKRDEYITKISSIEEREAVGIWQIIKLVADQYSLSQNINDASIAFSQGSLLNYIQKVVQKPWLQFFGDTVGDQYYFHCRKEPFDYDGFTSLPIIRTIRENEVLSDDLDWYSGDIYSWYQIIPKGSFLGEQNLIFAYVKAVFFEEYAEIWGSKPNIQVSNYLNFYSTDIDNKMFNKALDDLRYMVESNMYLPFSREGVIVISGDNTIRRGYRIYYQPTDEIFYVDSVSHNYSIDDNGPSYTTTLRVSRGIVATNLPRYFNLVDFKNPKNKVKVEKKIKDKALLFYFDNGRSYLIRKDENFNNSTSATDIKMVNQISIFPELRDELVDINRDSIISSVELIKKHKGQKFTCYGNMDEDAKVKFSYLSKNRAITVKNAIISEYLSRYSDLTREQLDNMIIATYSMATENPLKYEDFYGENYGITNFNSEEDDSKNKLKQKAYKRNVAFYLNQYSEFEEKEVEEKGVAWKVNRENFYFLMSRKQFANNNGR